MSTNADNVCYSDPVLDGTDHRAKAITTFFTAVKNNDKVKLILFRLIINIFWLICYWRTVAQHMGCTSHILHKTAACLGFVPTCKSVLLYVYTTD